MTAHEIKMKLPSEFDSSHQQTPRFLATCKAYLQINKNVYTTDDAKITFVILLCVGKAEPWAIAYLTSYETANPKDTYNQFMDKFKKEF